MLKTKQKQSVIEKFKAHDKDTGSPEVQIGLLTEQISELAKHLKTHKKDNHSRLGLLKMVARRRALTSYLAKKDEKRHSFLAKKLEAEKTVSTKTKTKTKVKAKAINKAKK